MKTYLNLDFSFVWGHMPYEKSALSPDGLASRVTGKPDNRILDLRYRGTSIAIFRPARDAKTKEILESDKDVKKRAEEWVRTHGHLAEWMRRKYTEGAQPNWTDDMLISPVWTETVLEQFKSRKAANDFYWTQQYFDAVNKTYGGRRYSAFIFDTRFILIDHFPQQEQQCQSQDTTSKIPMGAG